ncbi:MAG: hypothetical protein HYY40_07340, partial [Bacteroidetes bacterium]|nr:hypothetical protein [Bacteroidota bacterium]
MGKRNTYILISALLLSVYFLLCTPAAFASHMMGGSVYYEYLGPVGGLYRYKIILKTYINCGPDSNVPYCEDPLNPGIGVYEGPANPATPTIPLLSQAAPVVFSSDTIRPELPDTCTVGMTVCILECIYTWQVDLPLTFQGYHVYYNRCCRNAGIVNLAIPDQEGMSFLAWIPPSLVVNSSPQFTDAPLPYLCASDTTSFLNTAAEPDGDQMIFSFVDPYNSTTGFSVPNPLDWPVPFITWQTGYNKNQPFGSGGYAYINANTGLTSYYSPNTGQYVVAVEVKEYRNNNLIGIIRRDLQLLVITCPPNPPPNLSSASGSGQTDHTVNEGDTVCFPIIFTDSGGDSLFFSANGAILDPSQTNPAATLTNNDFWGDSIVSTQFCWITSCLQGRSLPYLFTTSVTDNGCPPKTSNEVYSITVVPFTGPATITGDNSVCPYESGIPYSVSSVAGITYTWTITGGTQASGGNSNAITVNWGGAGAGKVEVTYTNPLGCTDGPKTLNVTINSPPVANAGSDQSYCSGQSVQIGSAGLANHTYAWTPTTGLSSSVVANPIVTLTNGGGGPQSTTFIVNVTSLITTCINKDTVVVTVYAAATVNAGTDGSVCSGSTYTLSGSIGGTASTATWTTSGTGTFNNPNSLTAVYTPSAADISAGTVTITLTTNDPAGPCPAVSDALVLTINPGATANAGSDATICSGTTHTLSGSIGGSAASSTWTTSGSGTFDNAGSLTATYTPSPADITMGTVTLTLTTNDPVGPCPAASDAIVLTINPAATVNAGADAAICQGSTYTLAGSFGGGASTITWTTSGTGAFSNPNSPTATYTPSAADISAGSVTLTLTTNDPAGPCPSVSDVMVLTINQPATANAGSDATICSGTTHTLSGSIGGSAVSSTWTTSGSGTFDNAGSLTATYTPSPADITMGSVTLTITTNDPSGPCPAASDAMILTINPAATVNAGADGVICQGSTYALSGSFGGGASTVSWTTSGTGTFSNPNSPTAIYTPSAADISMGSVTLTLTTNDPAGPCPSVSDAMVLTINQPASVNAGSDATICSGTTHTLAGSIGGSATSSTWTTSGSGTFDNANSLTATYTPSPADITMGSVTLTIATNDPAGPCPVASDAMILTINPAATVNAGADGVICQGSTYTLSGSLGGGASTVSWTTSGTGAFSNPNSPTATYTPSAADISAGSVTLTLTTNDPAGPCPTVTDFMVLTINQPATANAGSDATICSGTTHTLSGSIGGSAVSSTWTTSGSGTFDNAGSLTATYTPSPADITMGSVTLTITTNDPAGPCPAASDAMILTINLAATVNAGVDDAICEGVTYALSGSYGGGASTVTWTTSGTGAFSNPSSPTSTYTPSPADITMGSITLTLTTNDPDGAGPCPSISDAMILTINPSATVNAGPDDTICAGTTYTLSGSISGSASSAAWATSGSGLFDNPGSLTATYTPSSADTMARTVTLTLTTNDPDGGGPCPSVSDSMVLTINPEAFVNAGADAVICEGTSYILNGTKSGSATSILWTTLGTGIFSNPTLLNATYIPSAGDIAMGTVTLTITSNDPDGGGPCPAVSDQMILTINPAATVNAGPDDTICAGFTYSLAGIIGGSAASATWSSSGTGTFDNPSILTATYTPSPADITMGSVTLILVTNDPDLSGPCPAVFDQMVLTISPFVIADAGPDVSFCSGDTVQIGSPPVVNYSYSWSPVTGLNDPGISDPLLTLINLSSVPDTYLYIVNVTDTITTCTSSDSLVVIVRPYPIADAGNDTGFCSGQGVTIGTVSTAGYTYLWSPDTGLSDTSISNPFVSLTNSDTIIDTIIYTVITTVYNCSAGDSVQVLIYPLPVVNAGPDLFFCSGDSGILGTPPIAGYIYLWTPSTGLSDSSSATPVVTLTNPSITNDTTVYYLTVTTSFNCTDLDTVLVIVNHLPISDAGPDVSFCSGSSDTIGTPATTGYFYSWIPSTGLSDTSLSNPVVGLFNSDTIHDTLLYIVTTTVELCSTSDSVQVIVFALPVADAGNDVAFCSGDTVQIGSSPRIDKIYSWNPGTGLSDSTSSSPLLYLTNSGPGFDTLQYVVTVTDTITTCVLRDTVRVIVYPLPVPDTINGGISVCPGAAGVWYWMVAGSGSFFQWGLSGGGTIVAGQGNDTVTIDWGIVPGTYIVSAIETDSNSCTGDTSFLTVTIQVNLEPPAPEGLDSICDRYLLNNLYQTDYVTGSQYTWYVTWGNFTTPNDTSFVFTDWDSVGTGMIWFEEVNTTIDTVCSGVSDTLFVKIFPSPVATFITGNFIFCEDTPYFPYTLISLSGSTITWFLNGDTISSGVDNDTIFLVWDSAGIFEISVTEVTANYCTESLRDTVTVYKTPETSLIAGDTSICWYPADSQLYFVSGLPGSTYQWIVTGGSVVSTPPDGDSVIVVWDSVGAWNITVIETSIDSCVGAPVTLNGNTWQVPVASAINGQFIFCEDIPYFPYTLISLPGAIITWFLNGDTISSGVDNDTIYLVWDSAGIFTLQTYEITVNGCVDSLYDTVTVYKTPNTSAISGDTSICFYPSDSQLYFVSGLPGSVYQWIVTGGSVVSAPPDDDSIIVVWDSVGTWSITVIETSVDSCVGAPITLNGNTWQVPVASSINGQFIFCEDTPYFPYTLISLSGSTITWFLNGDTISSGVDNDTI